MVLTHVIPSIQVLLPIQALPSVHVLPSRAPRHVIRKTTHTSAQQSLSCCDLAMPVRACSYLRRLSLGLRLLVTNSLDLLEISTNHSFIRSWFGVLGRSCSASLISVYLRYRLSWYDLTVLFSSRKLEWPESFGYTPLIPRPKSVHRYGPNIFENSFNFSPPSLYIYLLRVLPFSVSIILPHSLIFLHQFSLSLCSIARLN